MIDDDPQLACLAAVDVSIRRAERLVASHRALAGKESGRRRDGEEVRVLRTYAGCLAVLHQYRSLALRLSAKAASESVERLRD